MTIDPAMPPVIIAAAAALLLAGALRTRAGGAPAAARIAGLTLLIACALGVSRRVPAPADADRPALHVLIDTSRSMRTRDTGDEALTRLGALQRTWLDPNALARLRASADVRTAAFDAQTRTILDTFVPELAPDGHATRLLHAVTQTIAGASPGDRLLVLTDGADTDRAAPSAAVAAAIGAGARADAVVVGAAAPPDRPRLALAPDAHFVFDAQQTTLRLRTAPGAADTGATLRVTERIGGAVRLILERPIDLREPQEIAVPVRPRAGEGVTLDAASYTAEIHADGDDAPLAQAHAVVQVSAAPLRVLLLEGEPSWDSRFLLDALRADPWIDATSLAAAGPRERILRAAPGAIGPTETPLESLTLSAESLDTFHVVVLGRAVERWITPARAQELAAWVSRGGAVVFLRADPIASSNEEADAVRRTLEAISPVSWGQRIIEGGRLFTTPEGRRDARLDFGALGDPDSVLAALPGALATSVHEGERTLTSVWLRTTDGRQTAAAVAHLRVGAGSSLAVLSEGLWRWRMAPAEDGGAPGAYDAFWSHTLRRLAGMGDLRSLAPIRVAMDKSVAAPGEAVTIDVRARPGLRLDQPPRVRTFDADGEATTLTLTPAHDRAWRARFVPPAPGVYTIEADAPGVGPVRTVLAAAHTDAEDLDTGARPELMAAVAAATGGRVWGLDDLDAYLGDLASGGALVRGSVTMHRAPLWRTWWVFALIAALLGTEWLVRRARGDA